MCTAHFAAGDFCVRVSMLTRSLIHYTYVTYYSVLKVLYTHSFSFFFFSLIQSFLVAIFWTMCVRIIIVNNVDPKHSLAATYAHR